MNYYISEQADDPQERVSKMPRISEASGEGYCRWGRSCLFPDSTVIIQVSQAFYKSEGGRPKESQRVGRPVRCFEYHIMTTLSGWYHLRSTDRLCPFAFQRV